MPALQPVSKVIRYDFFSTWGSNSRLRDRLFFQYSGTLSSTDLGTLLLNADNSWNTNMSPVLNNNYTLTAIQGTDLTSNTAPQALRTTARVGTVAGNTLSVGTALVIKLRILRRFRGGHGRFYLGGQNFAGLTGNQQWTAAVITAVGTAFANFIGGCTATPPAAVGTLTNVTVSYFTGFTNKPFPSGRTKPVPNPRGTPLVDAVVSYGINPLVAAQRRRNQQSP